MIRGYFKLEPGKNNAQEKISALIDAGASSGNIFFEAGGFKELNRMLGTLRKGDTLIVPRATDVCRTKAEFAELIEKLEKKGAALRSLDEPWLDFNAAKETKKTGKAPKAASTGLSPATTQDVKTAGRPKGPRREIMQKLSFAFRMYHTASHLSVSEICKTVKLNERTFYRHLERQGVQIIRRPKGRKPKDVKA